MTRRASTDVLCYSWKPADRSTVRRHFRRWRSERSIPDRCDTETCQFHTGPLTWLDEDLPLILDHVNGNSRDNSPENLRFLCPNCDSQQPTRGGANRGRVPEATEGGYVLRRDDGTTDTRIIPPTGSVTHTGQISTVIITPAEGQ